MAKKEERISNSIKHPEEWAFWIEQARNITEEPTLVHLGNYRIPRPDMSGSFLYADTVERLWIDFMYSWNDPGSGLNSPSVYGKIQYIVEKFSH
jgi:hypothetical protein